MNKKNIWMAIVTDENEVVFSKARQSRQKAESAIVKYLQENEKFDGSDFEDACSWISENDLRLDLMVFEMESCDFNDIRQQRKLLIDPPPKEKNLFRVVYEIDVNAADERKAAETAWQMMQAEDAFDPVLVILDSNGKQTKLDLSDYIEFNKVTTGFVVQKYRKDCSGKFRCINQEFVAGDDVQFENLKGEPIEMPEHEYQQFNMLLLSRQQIIDRLGDVLTSIDVGGEQSRQFSHEIKILDELLRDLGWIPKD